SHRLQMKVTCDLGEFLSDYFFELLIFCKSFPFLLFAPVSTRWFYLRLDSFLLHSSDFFFLFPFTDSPRWIVISRFSFSFLAAMSLFKTAEKRFKRLGKPIFT